MSRELRCPLQADRDAIAAINTGDAVGLAEALANGGGSPRSDALKLIISVAARRPRDRYVLAPSRLPGQRHDPLEELQISPWELRAGLKPETRALLVNLLNSGQIWIAERRAAKRGPRADNVAFPKLWRDGFALINELNRLAEERAQEIARHAPVGLLIPVEGYRGIQKEAIDRFLASRPELGMDRDNAERYAKRALAAARALDEEP